MAQSLEEIGEFAKKEIAEQWVLAGHPTWGRFIDNLQYDVERKSSGDFRIMVSSMKYGVYMNYGVKAENVKRSRAYITNIMAWVRKKLGISDEKEVRRITWFIGEKHAREGIPGSGFLDKMREKTDDEITRMVNENINASIIKILS